MKPKLNKIVYTINDNSLTKSKVAYIGNDSFIIEHFNKNYDFGYEFNYKDYGITWFTNFKEAKNKILENEENAKLEKFADDYWEIIDNEI